MKKILVWETLSFVSGGQRITLTVMDLLKNDYDFCCLIPEKGEFSKELDARKIPYVLLGNQTMPTGIKGKKVIFRYAWLSVKAILRAVRAVIKYNPDILYAPGPVALPWSAICGTLTKKPVIWHLHHIFLDKATKKLLNYCGGFRSVKKIISVSNVVGDQIVNPKASIKRITVYNPVDVTKFSSGDGQKILDELKLKKNGAIIVGQIALLQPLKRQETVIRAAAALKQAGHNIKVLLVGRARDEDSQYVTQLCKLIAQTGMTENIFLMGQRSDVPDIIAALDLIIVPSIEGFSLVGLEAAAAGCPLLAADTGGAQELIKISGAGKCFAFDDAADAANKTIQIIQNRKIYSKNGRTFVTKLTQNEYHIKIAELFSF